MHRSECAKPSGHGNNSIPIHAWLFCREGEIEPVAHGVRMVEGVKPDMDVIRFRRQKERTMAA